MKLRDYQQNAVDAIHEAFQTHRSGLVVLPTGTGKTVLFSHVAHNTAGRVMVMAHREELIWQAADKLGKVTGEEVGIEMAEYRASGGMFGDKRIVVSSVQTLNAGNAGDGRMKLFDPMKFDRLIIDEAHHATADSYRRVITHFRQNPKLCVLGVTATPDRADEAALGAIFDTVAFQYDILDAVNDGWLVPVVTRAVIVNGLDMSKVATTAGDLNGADLAEVMEFEEVLHGVASPTLEITAGRKTLIFAASVAHAERLSEILNRHDSGCSNWVCGATPKEDRWRMFADFAAKKFRFLVNVGVATEGFDDPGIECVVMARPTKSRSLYAQMLGRGTRPLPGIVDRSNAGELFASTFGPAERRAAIAASGKPSVEVIDFVGNAGKHKLVTSVDILGGQFPDDVVERAKKIAAATGGKQNVLESLERAQKDIKQEQEEAKRREAARRLEVKVKAEYVTHEVDPFDVLGIQPMRKFGWDTAAPASDKQRALLEKQGIKAEGLSKAEASRLCNEIFKRWDNNQCSFKQAQILAKRGLRTDVSRSEAKAMIDQIAVKEGWGQKNKTVTVQLDSNIVRY